MAPNFDLLPLFNLISKLHTYQPAGALSDALAKSLTINEGRKRASRGLKEQIIYMLQLSSN